MAKNKTTETTKSVTAFVNAISDTTKRKDSFEIIDMMTEQTGFEAKLWGPSIIGFGTYHYVYESGREGDMPIVAFSPRSTAIVFYLSSNFEKREELLAKLGKHKTGKGCIYVKKLEDIDMSVLKKMVHHSVKRTISHKPKK
jgi:hypothetical protein